MTAAAPDPRDRHSLADDASSLQHETARDSGQGSFFGRRKGHKLRPHQNELIAHLLPRLSLVPDKSGPPEPAALFKQQVEGMRVEIGFGGGEHLVAEALAFPRTGFIGCEPYVNGMAKILAQIEAHDIGNIRLFAGDASELLAWLPEGSLSRIDLIHPDPWPKRRHWKRRFVQDATIAEMTRVLRPGGEFRFVSDIADYCAWTLSHLARSPDFLWLAERAADWHNPWPDYTMTRYGRKAMREGRRAAYLRFRRNVVPA
jgi:tRNA (guanine-N7-)-methyltransferase